MKSAEGFRIVSATGECPLCVYRCEVVVEDLGEVKVYCRHPRGRVTRHTVYISRGIRNWMGITRH